MYSLPDNFGSICESHMCIYSISEKKKAPKLMLFFVVPNSENKTTKLIPVLFMLKNILQRHFISSILKSLSISVVAYCMVFFASYALASTYLSPVSSAETSPVP